MTCIVESSRCEQRIGESDGIANVEGFITKGRRGKKFRDRPIFYRLGFLSVVLFRNVQFVQQTNQLGPVVSDIDFRFDVRDFPFRINDKSDPFGKSISDQNAPGPGNRFVGVTQQRKFQPEFPGELLVLFQRVAAGAEHDRVEVLERFVA